MSESRKPLPSDRGAVTMSFLARHGYAEARREPLAQDASFRHYLRLTDGPRSAVLMDAPEPEEVRAFLRVAAHLSGLGLSVPAIIAADPDNGLVLEEDLGDVALFPPPREAGREGAWTYVVETRLDAVIDVVVAMHRAAPPIGLPAWDGAAMGQAALGTLLGWWWPAAFGSAPSEDVRADFAAALGAILQPLAAGPRSFVHRDLFADNLVWLPHRTEIRRVGILDFQSGAIGHPAYDVVSLLQDARRDISRELAQRAIARYLSRRPDLDPTAFEAAFAACAAQRHLRVACQWVRLARRDHRPHYLAHGPRTWGLLEAALRHPVAAPLSAVFDRWIPPEMRANPRGLAA